MRMQHGSLAWILPLAISAHLLYSLRAASPRQQSTTSCEPTKIAEMPANDKRLEVDRILATNNVVDSLLNVPTEEVGMMAICASIRNEARFITEWLLYNRAMGVDRFYLYDTGSTDNTTDVLKPWITAGTVVLHKWNKDQAGNFQINSLEHCSRYHSSKTQWILDCDVDEFYVPTPALTAAPGNRSMRIDEMPVAPLRSMLSSNWLYQNADAVVASRVTWKNGGVQRLPLEGSVLHRQTLRDIYHTIHYDKLEFTKTLLHTRAKAGWVLPGAHLIRHNNIPRQEAKVITVTGQPVTLMDNEVDPAPKGTFFDGRHPVRTYEPLVMYHYVGRDVDNCIEKFKNAKKVRKGGWRDQAGAEGCVALDVYQETNEWQPMHEMNSFYAAAVQDNGMAHSWYGQHLENLITIFNAMAVAHTDPVHIEGVDPHPAMVENWLNNGLNPANGWQL